MRLGRKHPSGVELSRAACEGGSPSFDEHIATCTRCAATLASFTELDGLARQLPGSAAANVRVEETLVEIVATAEVRRAQSRTVPRWRIAFAVAAVVGTLAAAVSLRATHRARLAPPDSVIATVEPTFHAAVTATQTARFTRESGAPDEVIRLYEGTLTVDVTALRRGERFRIVVGDAEIEARGGSFEVSARGDSLDAVQITRGRADVRPARVASTVIVAGQRWDARPILNRDTLAERADEPQRAAPSPSAPVRRDMPPAPASHARPAQATAIASAPPAEPPMSELFAAGWQAFHAGDAAAAVATFDRAIATYPLDPLAEDVSFWRAMALSKLSRTQAVDAFAQFIDRYPHSPRVGEASVVAGSLELDAGQLDRAERSFLRARQDQADDVRARADKGLAAVASARAQ